MPLKSFTDYCSVFNEQRTITVCYLDFPLAAEPSAKEMKCSFSCDKYLYGYCPSASVCPIYTKL